LCALCGFLILEAPPVSARAAEGAPTFDVASVKRSDPASYGGSTSRQPTKIDYVNCDLGFLLQEAFDVPDFRLEGPAWIRSGNLMTGSGKYVVRATFPPGTPREQVRLMLQTLLRERFRLQFHREQREQRIYELVVDPGGPAFHVDPTGKGGILTSSRGYLKGSHVTMSELASALSRQLDRPVLDSTKIQGTTDLAMDWAPEESLSSPESASLDLDSIFVAIRKQLGLQLVPRRSLLEIVVIDRIDRDPVDD
jgi:uncharacterized protein (TIGR03435 family)